MNKYGSDYTRMRFSYTSGINEDRIVNETELEYMETIYELDDGRKILYDEISDHLYFIENTDLNYVTDEMWKNEFTRRLNKMILRKGILRKEFADLLGISECTMSRYITGNRIPNGYLLQRMSEILDCNLSYLTDFNYLL